MYVGRAGYRHLCALYTPDVAQHRLRPACPPIPGFWSETLFDAQRASFDREIYNGREYHVMRLKTMALFPTASGGTGH